MYTTKIYLKSEALALTVDQINDLLRTGIDRIETSTVNKEGIIGDVRDGIEGGCYGVRDGKIHGGVTEKHFHSRVFESIEELTAAGYVDSSENDSVAATTTNNKIGLVYHGAKNFSNTRWGKVA